MIMKVPPIPILAVRAQCTGPPPGSKPSSSPCGGNHSSGVRALPYDQQLTYPVAIVDRNARSEDCGTVAIIAHVDHARTRWSTAISSSRAFGGLNQGWSTASWTDGPGARSRITSWRSTAIEYRGLHINICDTPGHADFEGR